MGYMVKITKLTYLLISSFTVTVVYFSECIKIFWHIFVNDKILLLENLFLHARAILRLRETNGTDLKLRYADCQPSLYTTICFDVNVEA